jgi:hypothetical protein
MSHVAASVSFIVPFPSMMVRGRMSIQDKIDELTLPNQREKTIIADSELPRQIK